jgi:ABC-type transport system involved in multi-copper enzyme maturation permease subunit
MSATDPGIASTASNRSPLPGWRSTWAGLWGMTWRSVWSIPRWPVLGLLIFVSPVLAFLSLQTGELDPRPDWLEWVTRVHFGLVIPLWCLIAFGSFVRDEVQAGTIGFLLTRPLTRPRFLLVRWLCTLAAVQVPLALNTILLGATAVLLQIPKAFLLTVLLLGAQLLVVPAYGAIATFVGLLTRKYLLLGLVYGFVVEIGIGQIPTNINTLSVARHFRTLLELSDQITRSVAWSARDLGQSAGMLLLLALVYLAAGTLWFNFREYSQSEENKL